ncbi:xanthine dehydrogenase family protein molybdopterin-binding subunit [Hoyosella rhizosphaerae]|uniref:Isoquinoline 1-oxidoreductase subunit beta n=1 Tax=Hoyosella rhizosphaerae TaxID=1755582 RepID=A0A916XDX0_9ACTN|nr:molybdopterin cofactor-binding domain-containing protein [Hoyosella rhizosphaerae]MBN4927575.1 xanthine dehydrogenase family protein molybdopterin-binding subunit [Hoyosella rhizosphaerae]GGC63393.1 isoquinoline 1-oxidoreductase subunit beta [Hoyosella rhizosphaerae]
MSSDIGRRKFLTFLLAAPVLTVGAQWVAGNPQTAHANPEGSVIPSNPELAQVVDIGDLLILVGLPTALILALEVTVDGRIRFELPRAEKGQGITTATAMIVADELDVPVSSVDVRLAPAKPELFFNQFTGSSNTIRSLWDPLRTVASVVRARLIAAAAVRLAVLPTDLRTENGRVIAPGGRSLTYGELSRDAANPSLADVTARPKTNHTIVGTPTRRIDARAMVTGTFKYTLDGDYAGAKPVMLRRPPTINGSPAWFDEAAARRMPGVIDVAMISTGVAVMAETFGQAHAAAQALTVRWNAGTVDNMSDSDIHRQLQAAVPRFDDPPFTPDVFDAEYSFAFVSHAPLETNSAVADVRHDRAEIWSGLQSPIVTQQHIALELGLPLDRVTVHVTQAGGSFGRRLHYDGALEAARVSRAMNKPVKLMWSRIDDMRHGRARPASHHRIRARLAGNSVAAYHHRAGFVETDFRHGLGEILSAAYTQLPVVGNPVFAQTLFHLTQFLPYNVGAKTHELFEIPLRMPTASWRGVYSGNTRACEEIFIDEVAAKLGRDPVEYRRTIIKDSRVRAVLDTVAQEGNWGRPMQAGFGQGVGIHEEYLSAVAYLVEIDARDPKKPRVTKAVIAVDVGKVINPTGLEAQMHGALSDAIATTLQAGLHIVDGLPLEGSYSQFKYTRQAHTPHDVRVHILTGSDRPGGAGELGVPAAAGAVANAYARATGTRPRSFPINFDVDFEPFPR